MAIDNDKLNEFLGKFVGDLGATMAAGSVVIGHNLGLYKALAAAPASAEELAAATQTNPRYVAEWLRGQAASGYVQYDPADQTYSMTEEQAFALTNPDGGRLRARCVRAGARDPEGRAADDRGVQDRRRDGLARAGRGRLHRLRAVLPARLHRQPHPVLDPRARRGRGQAAGRRDGGRHRLRARRVHHPARPGVPNSRFTGSDYHDESIEMARKHAGDQGVADRVSFEVPRRRPSRGPGTTWPPPSTACTTWATRWPRPGTSARRSSPTAPGSSSSPPPPTTWRAT
jgi:hypothetical protein